MTDQGSQLDEIERLAAKAAITEEHEEVEQFTWIAVGACTPGGLYYEMRRELEQLRKEVEYHRACRKLDEPEGE